MTVARLLGCDRPGPREAPHPVAAALAGGRGRPETRRGDGSAHRTRPCCPEPPVEGGRSLQSEAGPHALVSGLAARPLREPIPAVPIHPGGGTWFWRPQDPKAAVKSPDWARPPGGRRVCPVAGWEDGGLAGGTAASGREQSGRRQPRRSSRRTRRGREPGWAAGAGQDPACRWRCEQNHLRLCVLARVTPDHPRCPQ